MPAHGEWNESRTQEGRKKDGKEASDEGSEESAESCAEACRSRENSAQQRRANHLELQTHRPSSARRLRRHGRRHVDPDRTPRAPHPLAPARERAARIYPPPPPRSAPT